jgi:hypothetical protein
LWYAKPKSKKDASQQETSKKKEFTWDSQYLSDSILYFFARPRRYIRDQYNAMIQNLARLVVNKRFHHSHSNESCPGHLINQQQPSEDSCSHGRESPNQHELEITEEYIRHMIYLVFIFLILVIPCLSVSVVYGYVGITSYLSMFFVISSTCTILSINALARLHRTFKFLVLFWRREETLSLERRRAIYVASAGEDYEGDIFDIIADQFLRVIKVMLFLGIMFLSKVLYFFR